jgi:signal transduction histidine kinase
MHDLASIDTGEFTLHREKFDLIETIQNITHEFLPVTRDRKINFKVNSQIDTFIYYGDRRRIRQLARELLQNAVKFTPNDGKIEITIEKNDNNIKISFKDTGIGIPSDKLKNIFERFYEVQDSIFHSSSKVEFMGGGLGLGLSLVKEVAEKHGGNIIVESHVNEGSTFIVTFPF